MEKISPISPCFRSHPPHPLHHPIQSQITLVPTGLSILHGTEVSETNIGRISTCMPMSFDTILTARPPLFEEGLCLCPLTVKNFAAWHLNSIPKAIELSLYLPPCTLSAPKGQPIQGGDRSKTMLLILSKNKNNPSHPNLLKVHKGEEVKTQPGGMSAGNKDRGGGGQDCLYIF